MTTRKTVFIGLLTAITAALTFFLQIPVAGGTGYIHLGDSIVYLTAFLFDGGMAAYVGAIGGAIADMSAGYTLYVIPTIIIKSASALVAGSVYKKLGGKIASIICSVLSGGVVTVVGYYVADIILQGGNFVIPLVNLPMNMLQVVFSIPIPLVVTGLIKNKLHS